MNYYNENDPKAAAWLRELILQGHIAKGFVDERSISDVQPQDLNDFTQCHFFAGIGGWSYALRLAGWPDDEPVWTGSCPCQPFSAAGKGLGTADHRHLWPEFARLIGACNPAIVFGEQVASAAGREWLAGARTDLEGLGYEVGAADLCAAGAGSPHIRQRLYWLADADSRQRDRIADGEGCKRNGAKAGREQSDGKLECGGTVGGLGNATKHGRVEGTEEIQWRKSEPVQSSRSTWSDFDILPCTDGKSRRIEPGSFPLAHGVSGRVGLLRGYGNAIVPQVAAQFIEAVRFARVALDLIG